MKVAVIKHLLVTAMLAVLAGCEMTVSDPFAGQDGIRVNMNGCKCVTWSESNKLSAQYTLASDYRFSSSTGLIRVIDETLFRLNLTVLDSQPLQTGKKYLFDGQSCEAILTERSYDRPDISTSLQGWIEFQTLSSDDKCVEALFELDGPGRLTLKHGFLRLPLKVVSE